MRHLLAIPLVIAAAFGLAACSSKSDTDNASASSNVSVAEDGAAADANLSGDNGIDASLTGSNALDANATDTLGNAGGATGNAL